MFPSDMWFCFNLANDVVYLSMFYKLFVKNVFYTIGILINNDNLAKISYKIKVLIL